MIKTMTETVRSLRDQQRAGGGASPVTVETFGISLWSCRPKELRCQSGDNQ
ncbi:hypothetical protein GPK55_04805 [Coprococcus eutactus]|uniref:hypothetical protein n=1 Tax=Coprococcus eutactus TaxID=33043 RepID=UPI001C026578|nr:hypothetical protein [Coprococcus eutactus]MBT9754686.1 hypothetical protein [Coprococcus eutactus]